MHGHSVCVQTPMSATAYAEESLLQLCGWQILEEPVCPSARIYPAEDHHTAVKDEAGPFRLAWNGFQGTLLVKEPLTESHEQHEPRAPGLEIDVL